MNAAETALWDNIRKFQFDNAGVSFKFSDRLARENGWPVPYTHRVIAEYRKFIFLCCVSTDGVTPSDPVDQAWHLHLTYTRSYWIDLCQNTLDKQIHHNSTKGGSNEADKFKNYYRSSNDLYKQYFGTEPPADIWHTSKQRFTDINFQRVNLSRYWLIRKPRVSMQSIVAVLSIISVIIFVQASELTIIPVILLLVVLCAFAVYFNRSDDKNKKGDNGSGCSSGCGGEGTGLWDLSHNNSDSSHHAGDSGCSSGCSSSGCSGCGGD